jgi:transposase InsO family protein
MPWKNPSVVGERERFVVAAQKGGRKFAQVCREFGISRKTGYKWCRRHHAEGCGGLANRSRQPRRRASPQAERWRRRALAVRRAHPHRGAKKLQVRLGELHGRRGLPSVRSIARWLKEAGRVGRPRRRTRRGPAVPHPGLTVPRRRHQVWTVDFKGWYRTADGERQEPLTVRELRWRYLLAIRLLPEQSDVAVRAVFMRVFRAHGLPEAIRVDNGAPFGGKGALGLTRLSVWWWRLGIRVEFMRPARPGDNAGHEQMHGLFAREVAAHAGADRAHEQRRIDRWRKEYNERRPHEALGQRKPAAGYQPSGRPYPEKLAPLVYPESWSVRRVRPHGDIKWEGRLRFIGRAFGRERVGLKNHGDGIWEVSLGTLLIGELHAADPASMRPATWERFPKAKK